MTDISKLVVSLEAESSKLRKDLDKANRQIGRFGTQATRTTALVKKSFIALGGVVGAVGFAALTKKSLDFADGILNASEKTGFAAQHLQELRFAAGQADVGLTELEGGLARFTKRLGLARIGTGAAADTYRKLGIDLSQTNREVFEQAVETLGSMKTETDRLALSTRLFGDDAQRLGVLFKDGNLGLQLYADKARSLGLILSDDLVRGASDANDQLTIMKQVINIQTVKIFTALAPIITQVGQAFADAAPHIANFFSQFGDVENLTRGAAIKIAKGTQEVLEKARADLDRRLTINADPSASRQFADLFLPSEEALRKRIAAVEDQHEAAMMRLGELNASAAESFGKPLRLPKAADLSGLLNDLEDGAKKTGKAVDDMTGPMSEWTQLLGEAESLTEDMRAPLEEYRVEIDRYFTLLDKGLITQETYNRAVQESADAYEAASDSAKKAGDDMSEFARQAQRNIQDQLGDTLFDMMQGNFDNIADSWKRMLDRMVAEDLAKDLNDALFKDDGLLSGLFKSAPSGGDSGGGDGGAGFFTKAVDWVGGLFAPKALGGPVSANTPYLVGERGPELFMPASGGSIIPNNQLAAAGGGGNMNITVNVSGASMGRDPGLSAMQIGREAGRSIQRALARNG